MAILKQVVDLQETVRRLMEQNYRLMAEKVAAVEDIRRLGRMEQNICPVCVYYNKGAGCPQECPKCLKEDNFKWRGVQEGKHE